MQHRLNKLENLLSQFGFKILQILPSYNYFENKLIIIKKKPENYLNLKAFSIFEEFFKSF